MRTITFLPLIALSILAHGCSERRLPATSDGLPVSDGPSAFGDGSALDTDPACSLPPGVHGTGAFVMGALDIDQPGATFSTDLSTITVTLPFGSGGTVTVRLRRDSSLPVLPTRLPEPEPESPDSLWDIVMEVAWCNAMECRIDFQGSSTEPSDHFEGWLGMQGPPGVETLFSNLSSVTVCGRWTDDWEKKSVTVNVVASRP